jgi:hypothetical protein
MQYIKSSKDYQENKAVWGALIDIHLALIC